MRRKREKDMRRLNVRSHVTKDLQEIMLPILCICYADLIIKKDLGITVQRKENIYSKHNFKSLANTIKLKRQL